jgi:hypothetical protein
VVDATPDPRQRRSRAAGASARRGCDDDAVALPDRVTPEEVALVFRRAAELEAAGVRGDGGGMLDDRALEDIGREVGLSPGSIRAALAELRGGALTPAPAVTWGTVSASRAVPGSAGDVLAAVDDEARRNQLGVVRRIGDATVWGRSRGASAAIARSLRGRRHHPLLALKELRATVVEVPSRPEVIRVRLEGSLVFPWRLLSPRGQALSMIGVGGGVLLAMAANSPTVPDWHYDVTGVLGAVAGTGVGLRSYRRTVMATESALDAFLDRLASGAPARAREALLP